MAYCRKRGYPDLRDDGSAPTICSYWLLQNKWRNAQRLLYAGPQMMPEEEMQQAMALLWKRHRPDIVQRVEALAQAAQALGAGNFTREQRSDSRHIAHGLAGVLGTFGVGEGTAISRRLELLFEGDSTLQPHLEEINKAVADLRRIVLELS